MKKITIYSTPTCMYCKRAKALLEGEGIAYTEVDLASNPDLMRELVGKYNWQTVPMIEIDDEFIGGFDDLQKLHSEGKLV